MPQGTYYINWWFGIFSWNLVHWSIFPWKIKIHENLLTKKIIHGEYHDICYAFKNYMIAFQTNLVVLPSRRWNKNLWNMPNDLLFIVKFGLISCSLLVVPLPIVIWILIVDGFSKNHKTSGCPCVGFTLFVKPTNF
jgi:hypothetical protein